MIHLPLTIEESNRLWHLLNEAIDRDDLDSETWLELRDRLVAAAKQKMGTAK